MKRTFFKALLSYLLAITYTTIFAQEKTYFMPKATANELQQFVGQRVIYVKCFNYNTDLNSKTFTEVLGGKLDELYTIKSIKGKDNYKVVLEDSIGNTLTVKITSPSYYNTLSDMQGFFLVDKFESDHKKYLETVIYNDNGDSVAKVVDIEYTTNSSIKSYYYKPKEFTIKSLLDGSTITINTLTQANKLCSLYGKVFSHSLVKNRFKIVGSTYNNYNLIDYKLQSIEDTTITRYVSSNWKNNEMNDLLFMQDIAKTNRYRLIKVDKTPISENENIKIEKDKTGSGYSYTDDLISISISCDGEDFCFMLFNWTNDNLRVNWNDARYIDYRGETSSVMHSGIRYLDRYGYQPPSILSGMGGSNRRLCNTQLQCRLDKF